MTKCDMGAKKITGFDINRIAKTSRRSCQSALGVLELEMRVKNKNKMTADSHFIYKIPTWGIYNFCAAFALRGVPHRKILISGL